MEIKERETHRRHLGSGPPTRGGRVRWPAILLALASLVACSKAPPEITSESREDAQDFVFAVSEPKTGASGEQVLRAVGRHQGKPVAFDVRLRGDWVERRIEPVGIVHYDGGTVDLVSVGPESDALLNVLDRLYVTGLSPSKMDDKTEFNALAVAGNPKNLQTGPVKLRLLFVDPDDEERYAEVYLKIDLPRSRIELLEKDEAYRRPFLLALAAPNEGAP